MPTLRWLTRDRDLGAAGRVPYRLIEEVPELGYGDPSAGNMLVQGDNLEALKALLPHFAGKVKCIYIDPPYNTGSAFEHYDDNLEHSEWLAMMWPRLELLRELLCESGSIWVSIDDREGHYLKVVMDEIFGRRNFIANIVWQKRTSRENRKAIGSAHDHILVYARTEPAVWKQNRNLFPDSTKGYSNPDGDERGPWRSIPFNAQGYRANQMYKIVTPTGLELDPPKGRCWGATEPEFIRLRDQENRVYFPRNGNGRPRIKKFPDEEDGLVPMSWWPASDFSDNQAAKKEILSLFPEEEAFDTPKPEGLIRKIVQVASNPGDLVLDSFLGSGTTAAVAQKTGRMWIGVEMGEHATDYCIPRLQKVVDGDDGGISEEVGWKGGGGFRFHRLGPTVFGEDGAIQPNIRFPVLAAHVWFSETGVPWNAPKERTAFLGEHGGRALALLYNGVLGDRSVNGGNVLTRRTLAAIRAAGSGFSGPLTIYGERTALAGATLKAEGVEFRQTPYDVKARK